jgi:hypothetical protein
MVEDTTRWRRRLPVLALTLLAAGAACGGGSGGRVATLAGTEQAAGKDTAEKAEASDKDPEEAFLDFARCMREHGIDMPDPQTAGGGDVVFKAAPAAAAQRLEGTPEQFEAADKECRPLLGDAAPAKLSPEQQQEMQDSMVAFARCMRENGVDMPDPEFSDAGGFAMRIGGEDAGPKFDPMSDEFQAAQEKCDELMPGMKGMKGGGTGGPMIAVRPGGASSGASTSVGSGK